MPKATTRAELERSDAPELPCTGCGESFPRAALAKKGRSADGTPRYGMCQPCQSVNARATKLRLQFSLTVAEYDAILAAQGGGCAICLRPMRSGGLRLSVDHHHDTGLVRGILCWVCNAGLQRMRDDPEQIRRLLAYVEHPPAVAALGEERYGRKGRVSNRRRKRKYADRPPDAPLGHRRAR